LKAFELLKKALSILVKLSERKGLSQGTLTIIHYTSSTLIKLNRIKERKDFIK